MKSTQVASFLLLNIVALVQPFAETAEASVCEQPIENKREPIAFSPFPLANPQTGEVYLPNEEIEIAPGRFMQAGAFFSEINDLEYRLNQWGYTLRQSGTYTLGGLDHCLSLLSDQKNQIGTSLFDGPSPWPWELDESLAKIEDGWNTYRQRIPTWDALVQKADDSSVKVYLPPAPAFQVPVPQPVRVELKDLVKERSWAFEVGEKSKFYGAADATLRIELGKTAARAHASGHVNGGLFNVWYGEVLYGKAEAQVGNGTLASLHVQVNALGFAVINKVISEDGINLGEEQRESVDFGVDYRFAIGPVPMRGRVGFQGGIGIKYGFQVVPIQIGAYAVPFAYTNAYAQVGADIGIAGAGVGGELILLSEAFTIKGVAAFTYEDEPALTLELVGENDLQALAGRLYAYAYFDYFFGRFEEQFNFWSWEGFRSKGEAFRFRTVWTPSGVIAEGDVTLEDVKEIDEANRERSLVELENEAAQRMYDVAEALRSDLASEEKQSVGQEYAQVMSVDEGLARAMDDYAQTLAGILR